MSLSYVYKLTHRETHHFYFGSRTANKQTALLDIGVKYFTSSKYVKQIGFENFHIDIIEEFINGKDAYDCEQRLIFESFKNPLCLNRSCFHQGEKRFSNIGNKHSEKTKKKFSESRRGKKLSEEAKKNMSKAQKGKTLSSEHKEKIKQSNIGKYHPKGLKHTDETKEKIRQSKIGKTRPDSVKEKISKANKGRIRTKEWRDNHSIKMTGRESAKAKSVIVNGVIYKNVKLAANAINKSYNYVYVRLRDKTKLNSFLWQVDYI